MDSKFLNKSDDVLIVYRTEGNTVALRISQASLARVSELEDIAATARAELIEHIEAGLRAETGDLIIDEEAYRKSTIYPIIRPARARDGKRPRTFTISSRECRLVRSWVSGENEDANRVFGIIRKARTRAWTLLRRECQAMRASQSWHGYWALLKRELSFHVISGKILVFSIVHRFWDVRPGVGVIFTRLLEFHR